MNGKIDIHGYQNKMANVDTYIGKLSSPNKELVLSFKNFLFTRNLSIPRILRYMQALKRLSDMIGECIPIKNKAFDKLTKQDIQFLVGYIQQQPYSPHTKHGFKVMLKKFICWIKNCEDGEIPPEVKWIKTSINKSELTLPGEGDLLTPEDVQNLMNSCEHQRDRTLISILYESGCRIGEVASIRIGNVAFDKFGVQIHVFGKTGARRIRLVQSAFLLKNYISLHPNKNDKNACLWFSLVKGNMQPMQYNAFKKIIKKAFVKAGINKKCNPHIFRHARATEMASHLTEFQMNQYFGWTQGSNMPSTYVHMNGKEVDHAILVMNGVQDQQFNKPEHRPTLCSRCEFLNPANTQFCLRCSLPLQVAVAIAIDEREAKQKRMDLVMNELIKQPEVQRLLLEKIRELGLSQEILR